MLKNIPSMISAEDNLKIERVPKMEEVNTTVFEISGSSVAGPDSFIRLFF